MYNLTEYWKENRSKGKKRGPTQWLNGRGSHFSKVVTVYRGRKGKTETSSKEAFEDYVGFLLNEPTTRSSMMLERGALCAIEQILNIKLIRQYSVSGFCVDGYDIDANIVYEIDEAHHFSKASIEKDLKREEAIKAEIGCKFVRISV